MENTDEKPAGERLLEQHGDASFSIGEVAKMLGVNAHTIRYWESEFKIAVPRKVSNRRIYTRADISLLKKIQRLAYKDGMSLKNARHQLVAEGVLSEAVASPDDADNRSATADRPAAAQSVPDAMPRLSACGPISAPAAAAGTVTTPTGNGHHAGLVAELQTIARLLREP